MTHPSPGTQLVRQTLLVYMGLMVAWTLTWLLKINVTDPQFPQLATGLGGFLWWTFVKTAVWIVPAWWLIQLSGRTLRDVAGFANWKRSLAWGGGVGLLAALTRLVPAMLSTAPLMPLVLDSAQLNALVIAPIYEEFLTRGALMGNLQQRWSAWTADAVAALMFVGLHIPGWFFMGTLGEKLTQPVGGALSIFVLGLAFGYAVQRSGSLLGGVFAHFLSNLASSL
jgi:membrane protease YdiL (CAAX protease family)